VYFINVESAVTRGAQVKTNIEDGNLVYLSHRQATKSGLNKSMLDAARGQFTAVTNMLL
jgi:hypothetical protein